MNDHCQIPIATMLPNNVLLCTRSGACYYWIALDWQ